MLSESTIHLGGTQAWALVVPRDASAVSRAELQQFCI